MTSQRASNGVKVLVGDYPDRHAGSNLAGYDGGIYIASLER
jgi:hypothetical protein